MAIPKDSSLRISNYPKYSPNDLKKQDEAEDVFATSALPDGWRNAYLWAASFGIVDELFHAINSMLLWKLPVAFGTFLEIISSDLACQVLEDWSDTKETAQFLFSISDAVRLHPIIQSQYPPLPSERAAASQFKGDLKSHYLIALLTQGLPPGTNSERAWLFLLKLWVLVQSGDRAFSGNIQDRNIRVVADSLRKACDQSDEWRQIVLNLKTTVTDFELLSQNIVRNATRLLEYRDKRKLTAQHIYFLNALIKVSRGEHSQDAGDGRTQWPIIQTSIKRRTGRDDFQPELMELSDEDDQLGKAQWVIESDESDAAHENLCTYKVDSRQSYTHQKLQGNAVILHDVEELQYLPWTWNRPNTVEREILEKWIGDAKGFGEEKQFLAVVVWIAVNLGRSLQRVLDFHIGNAIEREWGFNPVSQFMERLPPRRDRGWHPKSAEQEKWVVPAAVNQQLALPDGLSTILMAQYAKFEDAALLGDLWEKSWEAPSALFREEFGHLVPRITPGMLANALPQNLLENTGDQSAARLMASHPRSALPAATAYSSWSSESTSRIFPFLTGAQSSADNAMGSLLDPIESLLVASIREATEKLEGLGRRNDLVRYHNAYTAYLIVGLLALTGVRPVRDPFERFRFFDFDENFVYVNDKSSADLMKARLVPISRDLREIIRVDYICHLKLLVKELRVTNPALAGAITKLDSQTEKQEMPFFFLLTEHARWWKSVSENEIVALDLFRWPLPLNHFRHRLATGYRKLGLDPEIIDALLGHAEMGTATHGDYSFRVWQDDMKLARPAIEGLYRSLGFKRIREWKGESAGIGQISQSADMEDTDFGEALREKKRRLRFIAAVKSASLRIREFLAGRALSDLEEIEIDRLSRELLFRPDGMPHPSGYVKYRVLLRQIEKEWKNRGKKVKLSKRYHAAADESSPFTKLAPGAIGLFAALEKRLPDVPHENINEISPRDAAAIAATLLCLENRISSKALLMDILAARNFRLVLLKNIPYMEYSRYLNSRKGDVSVQRFRIPDRTAVYLDRLLSTKSSFQPSKAIPGELLDIAKLIERNGRLRIAADVDEFVGVLAELVDQVNVMTLAGIYAGYLGGRVESYSRTWKDWARIELGYPIKVDGEQGGVDSEEISLPGNSPVSAMIAMSSPVDMEVEVLQKNAREFLGELDKLLAHFRSTQGGTNSFDDRKKLARSIEKLNETYDGKISTTVQLLGKWCGSMLFRRGKGGLIRVNSVERYLVALGAPFSGLFYATDILLADEDDLTQLYSDLIESITVKDKEYVLGRLTDFHRWAQQEYGIEDPDWGELPEILKMENVSPGLITESEYLAALQLLINVQDEARRRRLAAPLLLLLCYRFGMRIGEALNLQRSDLQIAGVHMIVYVQNNQNRKLKTPTSRRQIPLLFDLHKVERDILDRYLAEHDSVFGTDCSASLFYDVSMPEGRQNANLIKRRVATAVKIGTGNTDTTIHHTRHSAANVVLMGTTQTRAFIRSMVGKSSFSINAEQSLLGRVGVTRRKMWAVSRFLGHVRRDTTCRSYIHFLGEMVDHKIGRKGWNSGTFKLKHAIRMERFPKLAPVSAKLLEQVGVESEIATSFRLLQLMRLHARGRSLEAAASVLSLDSNVAVIMERLLQTVGEKIKFSHSKSAGKDEGASVTGRLLRRLKEPAWDRLIKLAAESEKAWATNSNSCQEIAGIGEMIGVQRQIVLWEEKHFELLSTFLAYAQIQDGDYMLVTQDQVQEPLRSLIQKYHLTSVTVGEVRKEKTFQMDTAQTSNGKFTVNSRCAFLVNENDSRQIRNSVELLVSFIAFSMAQHRSASS